MSWYILERNTEPDSEPLFWQDGRGWASFGYATEFHDDHEDVGLAVAGHWVPEEVAVRLVTLWQRAQLADGVAGMVLSAGFGVTA